MTSTNDGKEVKSYQTSGPKGKTYFIELYKSLEARLNEATAASDRTEPLCEAWRRVHSLCQHSALTAHSHLLSWLQKHTARTVLPVEWQLPERKEDHARLEEAINVFIVESRTAAASRDGSLPWEEQLVARGEWFKKILDHPWKHPVLSCLLNTEGTPPTDDEVLEWLKEERGVTFVMRLHTLVAEKCDDIAISLASAVMERVRSDTVTVSDLEETEEPKEKPKNTAPNFGDKLREEAGFTVDVWEMLTDIEFVLLHKRDSTRCIALAKQTPLRSAYQLIERLQSRLDTSPREKRLWKYSKEVAVLIAQVVIARCMVVPVCSGVARSALYCCGRSLARLSRGARLPGTAAALAAPAPTAAHLHTLAAAIDAQLAQKNDASMKPFVCELYVRAITAGMNELERLKLKTEKDTEARSMEATLANWFVQLGGVLASSDRVKCECALTAFSVHPSPIMYERIKAAPALPPINLDAEQKPTEGTTPEFGSWASDSRGQTNFVKTSETLHMKARQNQANVLSTAILTEGEALGLSPELCQDITVLLSGPRVKTLSWDMDRELLLENCRAYLERTHGGTKAVTTELKYLNLNPDDFQYLPEEDEDESNIYYGIEKGYEHLVEFQEPEELWEDAYQDDQETSSSYSSDEFDFVQPQRRRRTKKTLNSDEGDPLSFVAETKRKEKKERPHSKERSKERKKTDSEKKSATDPLEISEGNQEKKEKPKRVRKKKEKPSLANLVGLKVGQKKAAKHTDSDADSQKSVRSVNSDVQYDGTFSMDEMRSPNSLSAELASVHSYLNTAFNRPYRPQSVSGLRIASPSPSKSYSTSDHSRNNSPTHISDEVKNSITKLLEYRRQKTKELERKKPNAIIHPEGSPMDKINISPKAVVIPEIPKSYINKQSDNISLLKPKVDCLSHISNAAIPSPVIQYASKVSSPAKPSQPHYSPQYQGRMTPSDRCFSTPPSSDRFLDNVNLISIYDKSEPSHSRSSYKPSYTNVSRTEDLRRKDMSHVNYQDYIHEYSLNSYNQHMEKNDAGKKVIRPASRVTPVVPHMKSENRTLQSAKQMPLKKPDGSLNTFSRLSYYKNKQTDMRKSQELPQSQPAVCSKLDGFIMNHLHQSNNTKPYANQTNDYQTLLKKYEKPQMNARDHPLLSNILQSNTTRSTQDKPTVSLKTVPSDKDQNDLLLLLRQQKALNMHNTSVPTFPHSPLNSPIASGSKAITSTTDAIYDPNNRTAAPNVLQNPQVGPNETTKTVNEGKVINVLSSSIIKAADQKTKESKPKPPSKKPTQGKPKKTVSKVPKNTKSVDQKDPEEWENVMNAILKQKTPCRGPKALEITMNKSSFEKAFMDSLRNPTNLFAAPDKTPSVISRSDFDHEKLKKNSNVATSSTSLQTPKKEKITQHTQNDSKQQTVPKKSSKTKKSSTPTVAELLKQRSDEEKLIEKLIQQNQIHITKRDSSGVLIKNPDTTPKQDIVNPKPAQQWLLELTKTAAQQRGVAKSKVNVQQSNNEYLKNIVKENNIIITQVKQIADEKPKKDSKPVSGVQIKQSQDVRPRQDDPFVSGIPNSDYDLLDELIDDDLRKEIGELSSDEESYTTTSQNYLKNTKTDEHVRVSVVYNSRENASKLPVSANSERPKVCKQKDLPQSFAQIPLQQPLTNKEALKMTLKPSQNKPIMSLNTNVQNVTHEVTKPTQIHAFSNASMLRSQITVEPNVYIKTAQPSATNVMIIPSSRMYEGYTVQPAVQTVPNLTPNAYIAVSNTPSISLYQATQFVAPVINPLMIANAVAGSIVNVVPIATTVQPKLDTKVEQTPSSYSSHELPQQSCFASAQGNVVNIDKLNIKPTSSVPNQAIEKDVQKFETKVPVDDNLVKTGEKKVLKEVQCFVSAQGNVDDVDKLNVKVTSSVLNQAIDKDVQKFETKVPVDDNLDTTGERKVLKEVQCFASAQGNVADVDELNVKATSSIPNQAIENDVQKFETKVPVDDNLDKTGERKLLKEVQCFASAQGNVANVDKLNVKATSSVLNQAIEKNGQKFETKVPVDDNLNKTGEKKVLKEVQYFASTQGNVADVDELNVKASSSVPNQAIEKDVQKFETKVPVDDNLGKTGERKVLKEVQEKHTVEKIESKRRQQKVSDEDVKLKTDQERVKRKRMAILNRKINYFCGIETIALGYSPLQQLSTQKEEKTDEVLDHSKDDVILSNQINLQDQLHEEIKSPATPDSYKENKNEPVRRILLRSSNKLKIKLNSPSTSSKPSLDKKNKGSLVHSIDTPTETTSKNAMESNNKSKRVSKRTLNKSVITPKGTETNNTNVSSVKCTKTSKTRKKNQRNTSSTVANSTPNEDLETEQFFDFEAELLGSTIPKITPMSSLPQISLAKSAQDTEEPMRLEKGTENLLIQKEPLQRKDQSVNESTKSSEFKEPFKATDQSVISDFATNKTEEIIKINNGLPISNNSASGENNLNKVVTEKITKENDIIVQDVTVDTISKENQSITNLVQSKHINVNTSNQQVIDTDLDIASKAPPTQIQANHFPVNVAENGKGLLLTAKAKDRIEQSAGFDFVHNNPSQNVVQPPIKNVGTTDHDDDIEIVGYIPNKPNENKTPSKSFLDSVIIETITAEKYDPRVKTVRIKLPNGKSFKGVIRGTCSVENVLENPKIKAHLVSQFQQKKKKYSMRLDVDRQRISILPPVPNKPRPIEVVNLLSDDEDDKETSQEFETEYGKHKIKTINSDLFKKHQTKLKLKTLVPVEKLLEEEITTTSRSQANNKKVIQSKTQTLQESTVLSDINAKLKLESPASVVCSQNNTNIILASIPSKLVEGVLNDVEKLLTSNKKPAEEPIVLIDDSSNDSVNIQDKPEPQEKINELKHMLLKDLGVDSLLSANTGSVTSEVIDLMTDPVIDLTDKAKTNDKHDYRKIINRKCFIKLVRCDDMVDKPKRQHIITVNDYITDVNEDKGDANDGKANVHDNVDAYDNKTDVNGDEADKNEDTVYVNDDKSDVKDDKSDVKDDKSEENYVKPLPVSRSNSFSILEDFPTVDEENQKGAKGRSSPVMEIYELIASLKDRFPIDGEIQELSLNVKCDTEWTTTKKCEHINLKNITTDQLKLRHGSSRLPKVPKLTTLLLSLIQTEDVINRYTSVERLQRYPNSLKRKSDPSLLPFAKMSKLVNTADETRLHDCSHSSTTDFSVFVSNVTIINENDNKVFSADTPEELKPEENEMIGDIDITPDLSDADVTNVIISDCNDDVESTKIVEHEGNIENILVFKPLAKISKLVNPADETRSHDCSYSSTTDVSVVASNVTVIDENDVKVFSADTPEELKPEENEMTGDIDITPDLSDAEVTNVIISDCSDDVESTKTEDREGNIGNISVFEPLAKISKLVSPADETRSHDCSYSSTTELSVVASNVTVIDENDDMVFSADTPEELKPEENEMIGDIGITPDLSDADVTNVIISNCNDDVESTRTEEHEGNLGNTPVSKTLAKISKLLNAANETRSHDSSYSSTKGSSVVASNVTIIDENYDDIAFSADIPEEQKPEENEIIGDIDITPDLSDDELTNVIISDCNDDVESTKTGQHEGGNLGNIPIVKLLSKISKLVNPADETISYDCSHSSTTDLTVVASNVTIIDENDDDSIVFSADTPEVLKPEENKMIGDIDITPDWSDTDVTNVTKSDCNEDVESTQTEENADNLGNILVGKMLDVDVTITRPNADDIFPGVKQTEKSIIRTHLSDCMFENANIQSSNKILKEALEEPSVELADDIPIDCSFLEFGIDQITETNSETLKTAQSDTANYEAQDQAKDDSDSTTTTVSKMINADDSIPIDSVPSVRDTEDQDLDVQNNAFQLDTLILEPYKAVEVNVAEKELCEDENVKSMTEDSDEKTKVNKPLSDIEILTQQEVQDNVESKVTTCNISEVADEATQANKQVGVMAELRDLSKSFSIIQSHSETCNENKNQSNVSLKSLTCKKSYLEEILEVQKINDPLENLLNKTIDEQNSVTSVESQMNVKCDGQKSTTMLVNKDIDTAIIFTNEETLLSANEGSLSRSNETHKQTPKTNDEIVDALNKIFGESEVFDIDKQGVKNINNDQNKVSSSSNDENKNSYNRKQNGISDEDNKESMKLTTLSEKVQISNKISKEMNKNTKNIDTAKFPKTNDEIVDALNKMFEEPEETQVMAVREVVATKNLDPQNNISTMSNSENSVMVAKDDDDSLRKRLLEDLQNDTVVEDIVEMLSDDNVNDITIANLKSNTLDIKEVEVNNITEKFVVADCDAINNDNDGSSDVLSILNQYTESNGKLEIKGIEYEDPIVGTRYVFSVIKEVSDINEQDCLLSELEENIDDDGECEKTENFVLMIPKRTYAKNLLIRRSFRNMKRKKDMSDIKTTERKYRKGKNIDYPKISASAIAELAYAKEYKRIIDYCSSIKFSYAIPYHIDHIDVGCMLTSWPVNNSPALAETDYLNDGHTLYKDTEDNESATTITDPLDQTLSDEILNGENISNYKSIDINETNFNKGFGERSGRVIQKIETGFTKLSAATLSDVKQYQPFSMSEVRKAYPCIAHEMDTLKVKLSRSTHLISLKEKVRSFFKKTALELNKEWLQDKKNTACESHLSKFPFGLTSSEFMEVPSVESVVNVVQLGQLPVTAAAQNPVTCDPRVTHVSDASPSQCSDNSPGVDTQASVKTEYTELTTANITLPLVQEYTQNRHQSLSQEQNSPENDNDINGSSQTLSIVKIELMEEENSQEKLENDLYDNDFSPLPNNNVEYSFEDTSNNLFNTSGNLENTANTNHTSKTNIFHTTSGMDSTFTNMFNNTTNLNNSYMDTTPSSAESTYTNMDNASASMYSTSPNMGNSSNEMDNTTNMSITSPNEDTTHVDNAMNIDNVSTNMDDTYTNTYNPVGSDSNDMSNTSVGNVASNVNSPANSENRRMDISRSSNLENASYDYSYEHIEDYAANMENNNNADDYSRDVDNYAASVENYSSSVDDFTPNVDNYTASGDNFTTGVENFASNVETYATNIQNYSTNANNYTANLENTNSNTENNHSNIDDPAASMPEEPQDLSMTNSSQEPKICNKFEESSASKINQIEHAMNAAGISSESVITSSADELANLIGQSTQVTANNYTKSTPINVMTLQQALAQVLPPPLNQTSTSENQVSSNPVPQQVLHIVQGSNAQTVINKPNGTHLLHIVQNKSNPVANGLSLVDTGLQQGGNQLIHIVNNGNQNNAQFLKRVNLLTNLTNAQGSNEQKMIQFVCKSADGKSIQLNTGHQRSMVLRLHPTAVQTAPKPAEPQNVSGSTSAANSSSNQDPSQEIKSRSMYEENYAQFIQNTGPTPGPSGASTSPCQEKATSLPKFNQVFGKQSYQENQSEMDRNGLQENSECPSEENASHLEQTPEVNNPPLLVRNTPPETTQAQPSPAQQIKQTISPMNIHTTMHGGVIYTRQIPVNIGGGQTINLITVPSTELVEDSTQKQQTDGSFVNQESEPSSIIKLVPHHTANNSNASQEEANTQAGRSNETNPTPQPPAQPVLTQMRIKLPMISKGPHLMPGARIVRPSFFQIQRNVIAGTNPPVYQQVVLATAPPLGQTIRLPTQTTRSPQAQPILVQTSQHAQPSPHIPVQQVQHAPSSQHLTQQAHAAPSTPQPPPVPAELPKADTEPDSELSTLTLEQLREFDMVLEQVKERSVQPTPSTTPKTKPAPADSTDGPSSASTSVSESTQQVMYSVDNSQPTNVVSYVNRKSTITSATTSFVRSPDSTGVADTPSSSTQVHITHTVTSKSSTAEGGLAVAPHPKKKKKKKPSSSSSALSSLGSPSKTNALKPQEDEQTTQRILYILAEYKEQVENSPDKNKPAPRRRNQFPPTIGSKRKRSHCSSRATCRREGVDMSPMHGEQGELGDDSLITLGSEDSSCGTTFSECTDCQETHSPEDTTKVVRRLTFEQETTTTQITQTIPPRNVIVGDRQTITVARTTTATTAKPTTTVLMPANYLLPVSMLKGGQQIAIMTNRGPKILVGAGDSNAGALLLQRLIGPGMKPVLARSGVRHIRLPTTSLHNLQGFNIQTTPVTQVQPPDSTAPQAPTPAPPDLVDTRAMSSPWPDREAQDKPERGPSPDCTEPWNIPSSSIADDYGYEEIVRTDNMERTVLVVQQRKDGRHHRVTHVSTAALRHKYAILEHELRLQKSLSEECEDLGVDSPSASDLFPEADILFGAPSPAHEQTIDQCTTPPPIPIPQTIPQPDLDDQIATDQLLTQNTSRNDDLDLNLDDVGEIVTVGEDGIATIPTINAEEFARSHPNTTFHTEPEDGEIPPFTIAQSIKGRHITFHANRVPGTVVMAPQTTVISQATVNDNQTVKFIDIDNMINSIPCPQPVSVQSVLVKDSVTTRPVTKFDLKDSGNSKSNSKFDSLKEPGTSHKTTTKFDSLKDIGHPTHKSSSKFDSLKEPGTSHKSSLKFDSVKETTARSYSKFDSIKEGNLGPKPLSKFDTLLTDSKSNLSNNSARQVVHPTGHGTQVIRRLRYDERTNTRTNNRFHFEEPKRTNISDEVKMRNDRAMVESMGDNASSPGHPELFWDSTTTERQERRFNFSESEKVAKSPFDELLNDSSAYGPHTRLDSVIKAARPERSFERTSFEGISVSGSSEETRPLRTYPPKRVHTQHTQDSERHFTLKTTTTTTHHHETKTTHHHDLDRNKKTLPRCQESEGRRRTGRGLVKRGCSCCNGSSAPPKKRSRPKKTSPTDLVPTTKSDTQNLT